MKQKVVDVKQLLKSLILALSKGVFTYRVIIIIQIVSELFFQVPETIWIITLYVITPLVLLCTDTTI